MPVPGIYLVNASGEMTALLNERNNGDEQLLREVLDEHGFEQYPDLFDTLGEWEERHENHSNGPARMSLRRCYNDISMIVDYEGRNAAEQ